MPSKIERRFFHGAPYRDLEGGQRGAEVRAAGVEDAPADGELPQITGYAAMFNRETVIESWYGTFREKIAPGAFARAIREKQNVRALRNHDPDKLLGTTRAGTLELKEDRTGLYIRITPDPNTSVGQDTVAMIRRGDLDGQSFAFIPRKTTWIEEKDQDGKTSELRIIEDVDLFDVGPVTYPAYEDTTVGVEEASRLHEEGLRSLGKQPVRRGMPAKDPVAPPAEPPKVEEKTPETTENPPANEDSSEENDGSLENKERSEGSSEESTDREENAAEAAAEEYGRLLAAEEAEELLNDVSLNLLTE